MTKKTVARRYAHALFNLLDPSSLETVKGVLQALADGLEESASLKHVLASPVFTFEEKKTVLTALSERTGAPPVMKDFLGQLLKKNRAGLLPEIAEAFQQLADSQQGKQQILVTSAKALNQEEQGKLRTELERILNREVDINFQTNPSLIAGIQVRVGSKVYNSTVKGRLSAMRAILAKG